MAQPEGRTFVDPKTGEEMESTVLAGWAPTAFLVACVLAIGVVFRCIQWVLGRTDADSSAETMALLVSVYPGPRR